MSNPRQNILNQKLILSAQLGDKDGVLSHLAQAGNPQAKDSTALREAAYHGHAECVKILISVSDPKAFDSDALVGASAQGCAECVKLLIPVSDPQSADSNALFWAAREGNEECLRLLIPFSDPRAASSSALRIASARGHLECAKLLLHVSDAKSRHCEALCMASANGHAECVKLLIPASTRLTPKSKAVALAIKHGHADVLAAMLAMAPRLLAGIDFSLVSEDARNRGLSALASLASSIAEQRAISSAVQASGTPLLKARSRYNPDRPHNSHACREPSPPRQRMRGELLPKAMLASAFCCMMIAIHSTNRVFPWARLIHLC